MSQRERAVAAALARDLGAALGRSARRRARRRSVGDPQLAAAVDAARTSDEIEEDRLLDEAWTRWFAARRRHMRLRLVHSAEPTVPLPPYPRLSASPGSARSPLSLLASASSDSPDSPRRRWSGSPRALWRRWSGLLPASPPGTSSSSPGSRSSSAKWSPVSASARRDPRYYMARWSGRSRLNAVVSAPASPWAGRGDRSPGLRSCGGSGSERTSFGSSITQAHSHEVSAAEDDDGSDVDIDDEGTDWGEDAFDETFDEDGDADDDDLEESDDDRRWCVSAAFVGPPGDVRADRGLNAAAMRGGELRLGSSSSSASDGLTVSTAASDQMDRDVEVDFDLLAVETVAPLAEEEEDEDEDETPRCRILGDMPDVVVCRRDADGSTSDETPDAASPVPLIADAVDDSDRTAAPSCPTPKLRRRPRWAGPADRLRRLVRRSGPFDGHRAADGADLVAISTEDLCRLHELARRCSDGEGWLSGVRRMRYRHRLAGLLGRLHGCVLVLPWPAGWLFSVVDPDRVDRLGAVAAAALRDGHLCCDLVLLPVGVVHRRDQRADGETQPVVLLGEDDRVYLYDDATGVPVVYLLSRGGFLDFSRCGLRDRCGADLGVAIVGSSPANFDDEPLRSLLAARGRLDELALVRDVLAGSEASVFHSDEMWTFLTVGGHEMLRDAGYTSDDVDGWCEDTGHRRLEPVFTVRACVSGSRVDSPVLVADDGVVFYVDPDDGRARYLAGDLYAFLVLGVMRFRGAGCFPAGTFGDERRAREREAAAATAFRATCKLPVSPRAGRSRLAPTVFCPRGQRCRRRRRRERCRSGDGGDGTGAGATRPSACRPRRSVSDVAASVKPRRQNSWIGVMRSPDARPVTASLGTAGVTDDGDAGTRRRWRDRMSHLWLTAVKRCGVRD